MSNDADPRPPLIDPFAEVEHIECVRKPSWLSTDVFKALLEQSFPCPRCKVCGTVKDLTVDHIVPRYDGGTDDLGNLQFLCRPDNSRKGIRPDTHWELQFYWDHIPDSAGWEKLRTAQRILYNAITEGYRDYFSRPISEIARRLYLNAWVVGSGKTLGIVMGAWALNRLILGTEGSAVRRVDRILVLVKEEAIRDQIAHDLEHDLVNYGIMRHAPRVGIVTKGYQFNQTAWLDQYDIVVACIQQLWGENGSRPDLAKILAGFPMIAIDEPHFAPEQVAKIVDTATSSVVLGFTGTPIDGTGKLLEKMVALTVYDYSEASDNDRGLKYLDDNPDHFSLFVREIDIRDADIIEMGELATTYSTEKDGYSQNIQPAKAVVRAVVEELEQLDLMQFAFETLAPHRSQDDIEMCIKYPAHAIIYFDSVDAAERLAINTNSMFEAARSQYPRKDGWYVEVVHAGGKSLPAKPLARDPGKAPHPWMHSYRHNGVFDKHCARLLFCVGMAREGVNNPYCALTGVACDAESLLAPVQGWIGRQVRAVFVDADGRFRVPPRSLDQIRIITHKTYNNAPVIKRALKFLADMRGHLAALPSIEDLDGEDIPTLKGIEHELFLPLKDKLKIVSLIGDDIPEDEIIKGIAPQGGKRADRAREWVQTVKTGDVSSMRNELHFGRSIEPLVIVMDERLKHAPSNDQLEKHIRIHHEDLIDLLPLSDEGRRYAERMYIKYIDRFQQPPLLPTDKLSNLARSLGGEVLGNVKEYLIDDLSIWPRVIWPRANTAIKKKLGISWETKMIDGGNYDTVEAHSIIRRPEVQSQLTSWVIGKLIDEGLCPRLKILSGKEVE